MSFRYIIREEKTEAILSSLNLQLKTGGITAASPPKILLLINKMEQAQAAPTPATIFSLFYNGKFVTTDISSCMDNRFDKALATK